MRIAVPVWNGSVSSVFDFAETLELVTIEGERVVAREQHSLVGLDDWQRLRRLMVEPRPEVLLCGAISGPLRVWIERCGVRVVAWARGPVDRVLAAYQADRLDEAEFRLPGCRGGGGNRCGRRRGGGHGPARRRRGWRDPVPGDDRRPVRREE